VPLWLHDLASGGAAGATGGEAHAAESGGSTQDPREKKRHRARRVEAPEGKNGFLMMFRAESLLSWADFIKVNRPFDDDPNPDAEQAANDMEELAVTRDGPTTASKVRFDLDLPSAAADDIPLCEGILLPEWDWRKRALKPDHCRLQPLTARDAEPAPLPPRLKRAAQRLRSQFAALAPQRHWLKNQPDGPEPDLDACVRAYADRLASGHALGDGGYLAQQPCERDLACLALADLSLSTDAWVGNEHRVIDVVKDSLLLFGEALAATGDRYAFYGFSSLKRGNVRFHHIKSFEETYGPATRGRIAALKPGYYTRMGAAIRHATSILAAQPAALRLLLILTDGKPNDLDHYDGRYGIEDTRMAVGEARRAGLRPFCITIDREGAAYLPHLFGPAGFTVIRQPEELPSRLPLLYAQLTASR
jgi:nitric oxide reductase NorD protein